MKKHYTAGDNQHKQKTTDKNRKPQTTSENKIQGSNKRISDNQKQHQNNPRKQYLREDLYNVRTIST